MVAIVRNTIEKTKGIGKVPWSRLIEVNHHLGWAHSKMGHVILEPSIEQELRA